MNGIHLTGDMVLAGLVGILVWIGKKYAKKLDDHVIICNKRAIDNASSMQWIGDSMHSVAQKVGADLPPRPRPTIGIISQGE